jgi:hypothetical protein
LQLARGEIFFAELDVIDSGACGFDDFFEEAGSACVFIFRECGAVGDVVEETVGNSSLVVGRWSLACSH